MEGDSKDRSRDNCYLLHKPFVGFDQPDAPDWTCIGNNFTARNLQEKTIKWFLIECRILFAFSLVFHYYALRLVKRNLRNFSTNVK